MSKTWRPDDWKHYESWDSPVFPHQGGAWYDNTGKLIEDMDSFEAGADAMLRALREKGRRTVIEKPAAYNEAITGVTVFIPDDPAEEKLP